MSYKIIDPVSAALPQNLRRFFVATLFSIPDMCFTWDHKVQLLIVIQFLKWDNISQQQISKLKTETNPIPVVLSTLHFTITPIHFYLYEYKLMLMKKSVFHSDSDDLEDLTLP